MTAPDPPVIAPPEPALERYYRDMAELRTHGALQAHRAAELFARVYFGLPAIAGD